METNYGICGEKEHQKQLKATSSQISINALRRQIREKHAEFEKLQKKHREMTGTRFYHF